MYLTQDLKLLHTFKDIAVILTANWVSNPQGYIDCMLEARFNSSLQQAPSFIQNMDTIYLSRVSSMQYSTDFRTGSTSYQIF
jgi:hypothetical protein